MFHSDSKGPVIWAYDYDTTTGAISGRRVAARPTESIGRPDGGAADVEGYYWSCGISAGALNRWSPDGRLDRSIPLPCSNPTAPCFGGPDMKTIYVTSLRHGVQPAVLAEKPLSGGIFAVQVDRDRIRIARDFATRHRDLQAWMTLPAVDRIAELRDTGAWPLICHTIGTGRLRLDVELAATTGRMSNMRLYRQTVTSALDTRR